ncbi:DNA helicase HerA-like ATPase [Microbacterium sp. SORGH_AS 1204]|uniref:type IV secretory system conjugative DNA transfer family protein n=1 Tax=Microbacterium sp. SORGH_AS_1204 TaxID=3041785 RepID=UPI00278CCFD0|nr:type IV secretory system conjugative DNA transfer family protein [Microbacterium sp. SORGH_AS_1204]MDQ1138463.1 DNA helicase HerA-like ATPase [Microbacterium sp. SORGH_AS_1204]
MSDLVFTRLHLPRPIVSATVEELLARLLSADVPRPVTFEVHAAPEGIVHILGCATTTVPQLKRLLRDRVAGIGFEAVIRPDVVAVSRVVAHPNSVPLENVDPENLVASLYHALAARRGDEHLAVQVVLNQTHGAVPVPFSVADPFQRFGSMLLAGVRPAAGDTRKRIEEHVSTPTVMTTLRIGATAESAKRIRALVWEVFGALQVLESRGVRLTLNYDTTSRWRTGTPRAGLRLSTRELLPLLGWPLGDRDYAGVPGVHPRRLAVAEIVSRTASVFAVGTAPGPERVIGIDTKSRLQHMVTIGPTGSGKSTLLEHLILSDIRAGRPCVVIEPKKQLVDSVLDALRPKDAEKVVVLDASDMSTPVGFNPLDVGDRDPDIVVDGIVAALAATFGDGWGPRTEYLIHGALLSLARAGVKRTEPYTLIDLPRLLTDTAFRRPVIAAVQDDLTLAAFWAEFEDLRPGARAAQIAAPLNKLRKILMRKPLVAVLGQARPRFRLRDIFRERMNVLVPLNEALVGSGASRLLGSLIVAEIFMATIERATEKNPERRPGFVFIDEVQNYLHLPTSVGEAMSVFRSYGVGLTVAHQHRGQLPPSMRQDFDVNARSKVVFSLEADDARDLARQAPHLTAEDFQALPQYEIYARLIAGGIPTPWCSARTLEPAERVGRRREIRDLSRARYGSLHSDVVHTPTVATPPAEGSEHAASSRSSHQKARRS